MNLSKSLYTIAIQCPKALWLKKYKPEVLTPTDEFSQAKFNIGHAVGELACDLLPNGIKVDFDYNPKSFGAQMKKANKINADYVLILGEDEERENMLTLKEFSTGKQEKITIKEVVIKLLNN